MSMEYGKDLEQLMAELSEDKLEIEAPRTVYEPETEYSTANEPEYVEAEDAFDDTKASEKANINDVKGLPELIVGIIDLFGATLAEVWTKTEDKSKYRLDEQEKEQLIKAWEMYLKTTEDFKVSPSTMLLLTTSIIYAPKVIMAISERKERKEQHSNEWENS